jgi:co-chaperonin GroES (HSP10)|tara:strand:- start:501 stop:935 length:435 start_codon:yes stop_codon:yes gene_type:complete
MNETVPNRVDNFGSADAAPVEEQEVGLTVETLDSHTEKLPHPTGYRILILPFAPPSVTKSGIHLAKQTVDRESLATVVGYVVRLGPDAYGDENKFPDGAWCQEGDWVIFGRYAGARFKIEGGDMRLLNDDEILAVIDNPEDILS